RKIVLITGVTGFIGYHILLHPDLHWVPVRAVVRSTEQITTLLKNESIGARYQQGLVDFAHIPDFSDVGSWKVALCGVEVLIHVAGPLPWKCLDPVRDILVATDRMAAAIFDAARTSHFLKRIILTSSISACTPLHGDGPFCPTTRVSIPSEPWSTVSAAYQASRINLRNNSHKFVQSNKLPFDVINILLPFVFGRNQMAESTGDLLAHFSNRMLLALLLGHRTSHPIIAQAAHIDDVVTVHIKAMYDTIPGNQDYAVTSAIIFNDAIDIARKHFPRAFESGALRAGDMPSGIVQWDTRKTNRVFEMGFYGFDRMVLDVVKQYLEFLE
ncbi:NAD(P)-binding protein, partial [Lindgomyces ingoldianus]